jgi:RHS repeat-associated protein
VSDAEGRTFIYDAENKQKEVKNSSNVTVGTYFYDGDGKRVKKVTASEEIVFVYDAGGKLVAEYSSQTPQTTATTRYLTSDYLGSPRIITDQNGVVLSRRDFAPFGEELYTGTGNRTTGHGYTYGDSVRQKFTSYERDNESDLDFAQARMYGYGFGRFTSPDPLAASANAIRPQSWNRYSYSYNNPLRFTDPSGMIAGDFYNLDGKKIGTDGVDDKKIHIVYDEKKAKEIKETKGNYTGTVDAKITLPGVNIVTAVNEAVDRSDAATFNKSGLDPLEKNQTENGGGFREAGITWDKDGNVKVEPDGPYADPRKENAGMVITPNTEGSAHVHPSGVITTTTRTTVIHQGVPTGATHIPTLFNRCQPIRLITTMQQKVSIS